MDELGIIRNELDQAATILAEFSGDIGRLSSIQSAAKLISNCIASGHKVLSIGNGGSHCDAMHFAEELLGNFRDKRNSLPAIAVSDPSFITCTANDFGFDQVFARAVEGLGIEGDVLLAISTSGNSENILNAVRVARDKKMKVVALTGNDGGKLSEICDIEINVPHSGYSDRIQEIHIKIIHILILLIEKQV